MKKLRESKRNRERMKQGPEWDEEVDRCKADEDECSNSSSSSSLGCGAVCVGLPRLRLPHSLFFFLFLHSFLLLHLHRGRGILDPLLRRFHGLCLGTPVCRRPFAVQEA